jgi:hypothetical protein
MSKGRRLDGAWLYFCRSVDIRGNIKATCRGCGLEMSGIVSRMWRHADQCKDLALLCPEVEVDASAASGSSQEASPPAKKSRQGLLAAVVTDGQQKAALDEQVAKYVFQFTLFVLVFFPRPQRFFVACNIPFRSVGNKHFIHLVSMLRPGYKPPERRALAGPLLDRIHSKELQRTIGEIAGLFATLMLDGWSTVTNDPVIAAALAVRERALLVGAEDTTGSPHTGEYLLDILKDYVQRAEVQYRVKVVAVTCDSAANMCKMKDLAKEELGHLFYIPCQAHWLNLAAKDVVGESGMLDRIVVILKWFSQNHGAHAGLREKDVPLPILPGATRWSSTYQAVHYFNHRWPALVEISARLLRPGDTVRRDLENLCVRRASEDLELQLQVTTP